MIPVVAARRRALAALPRPLRRLSLRGRVTLAFALLALGLSALLTIAVWVLVSSYLMSQREGIATRQAESHLATLERSLANGATDIPQALANLPPAADAPVLLYLSGRWYSRTLDTAPNQVPEELRTVVVDGRAATQRVVVDDRPYLVVGLPTQSGGYFELFPLSELDYSLTVLSLVLPIAAALTTALGAALGRTASRRALAPLTTVTDAAAAIASGGRSVRLDAAGDADLAPLADSFNRTAAALERRVEADARFAGDVSHELRTPLTTMVNAMEVLQQRKDRIPADGREVLDLLAGELHRFQRMVGDLLEISRAEDGAQALVCEEVSVAELVTRAADRAAGRRVTRIASGAAGLRTQADKRRLEQVVTNLVVNAEYHGQGVDQVLVERTSTGVRVVVDDRGPGIPADRRERIFERFARGPGQDTPGSGLGLAIVARHVRLHGGSVCVDDRPGGGARFIVELPDGGR